MLAVLGWALLGLLGVVAAVLLALLVLPVRLRLAGRTGAGAALRVELGLFGGLVPRFAVFDSSRPSEPVKVRPAAEKPKKTPARKRRGRRRRGRGHALRMLRAGPELVFGMLRQVRLERLWVSGFYGLGDPAETGRLYGAVAPVLCAGGWADGTRVRIDLQPDFRQARFDCEAELALALRPVRLLGPSLRFAWRAFGPVR